MLPQWLVIGDNHFEPSIRYVPVKLVAAYYVPLPFELLRLVKKCDLALTLSTCTLRRESVREFVSHIIYIVLASAHSTIQISIPHGHAIMTPNDPSQVFVHVVYDFYCRPTPG